MLITPCNTNAECGAAIDKYTASRACRLPSLWVLPSRTSCSGVNCAYSKTVVNMNLYEVHIRKQAQAVNNLDFRTDIVPFVIATAGEFIALFFWLQLFETGQVALATVVLWAGFLLERGMVVLWLRAIYREREGVERDY